MPNSHGLDLITWDGHWPLPQPSAGTPSQGYYDRIAYQTLLEPNRIQQAFRNNSGYIAMTCRLPGDVQFNLDSHEHHLSTDWQEDVEWEKREYSKANPILLATRLHFSKPHQMPGLGILADKFENYFDTLIDALSKASLQAEMDTAVGNYWPELTGRDDEKMHGKFQLDLITPFQLKHGRGVKSPMFRIQIPKDWGRILFGRLSDEIPEDDVEKMIEDFNRWRDGDRSDYEFEPILELPSWRKADQDRFISEFNARQYFDEVNDKLANTVKCPVCDYFTSSRRSMWGHITAKHHESYTYEEQEKWLEKNPVEPLISLRKLALPEPHENAPAEYDPRPRPEGAPRYLHHLTYPAMVTINHNEDTNKWTMSVPLWAKKQLFSRLNITSIGVEILWHSPNITAGEDWAERGRSRTPIPTPWNEEEPGTPMTQAIQAAGRYDRKYKHIKFHSNFNHHFAEWEEQGLESGMICLVKFNVDIPSHGPTMPPAPQ